MNDERKLVGLEFSGGRFMEINDCAVNDEGDNDLIAVGTSKAALGKELNTFCTSGYLDVPNQPGDDLVDVVIGDPYLLRKVKVVDRGEFGEISLPDDVREVLSLSMNVCSDTEIIVFENKDRSRVYVDIDFTTLLECVIKKIDPEFLEEE